MKNENYIFELRSCGIVSEEVLGKVDKGFSIFSETPVNKMFIHLFCSFSDFEIPLGTTFDALYNQTKDQIYKINLKLISVTQNWAKPYSSVPLGHKTICRFAGSARDIAIIENEMPVIDAWLYSPNFELLESNA